MMLIEVAITKTLQSRGRRFALDVTFASNAEVTVLFGPSGAGKTQTLYAIAGLSHLQGGRVRIGARTLFDSQARIDLPPRRRQIGFVFQEYALFPHLNVVQNVAFALHRGWPLGPRSRRLVDLPADVRESMEALGLAELAESYPAQLSGGQSQRVAVARALASRPQLLLLDEPFAAVDAPLRARMRGELLAARARFEVPMIVITHDPEDVVALGGRVVQLENGRVVTATAG